MEKDQTQNYGETREQVPRSAAMITNVALTPSVVSGSRPIAPNYMERGPRRRSVTTALLFSPSSLLPGESDSESVYSSVRIMGLSIKSRFQNVG